MLLKRRIISPMAAGPVPLVTAAHSQPFTRSLTGTGSREIRRLKIAVWDVANALPYRENLETTLAVMNAAQNQFEFRLERLTSPTQRVDAGQFEKLGRCVSTR